MRESVCGVKEGGSRDSDGVGEDGVNFAHCGGVSEKSEAWESCERAGRGGSVMRIEGEEERDTRGAECTGCLVQAVLFSPIACLNFERAVNSQETTLAADDRSPFDFSLHPILFIKQSRGGWYAVLSSPHHPC